MVEQRGKSRSEKCQNNDNTPNAICFDLVASLPIQCAKEIESELFAVCWNNGVN